MSCYVTIGVVAYIFALHKTVSLYAKNKDRAEQNLKVGVAWRRDIMLESDKFTEKGLRFRRLSIHYMKVQLILFFSAVLLLLLFGDHLFR